MQLVELRLGIDLRAYLVEHYVTRGRLLRDIAADLSVDVATVSRWKDTFGLVRSTERTEAAS